MSDPVESKLLWLKHVPGLSLTISEHTVLLAVFNYTDKNGKGAYPGAQRLADECNLTLRSVRRALASLEKCGYLVKESEGGRDNSGRGHASTYRLGNLTASPQSHELRPERVTRLSPKGDTPRPERVTHESLHQITRSDHLSEKEDVRSTGERQTIRASSNAVTTRQCAAPASPLSDDSGSGVMTIPDSWRPHGSHVAAATAQGLIATRLGQDFKKWATDSGQSSANWDSRFGKVIQLIAGGDDPGIKGFDGIEDYIGPEPQLTYAYPSKSKDALTGEARIPSATKEPMSSKPEKVTVTARPTLQLDSFTPVDQDKKPAEWIASNAAWFYARDKMKLARDQHNTAVADFLRTAASGQQAMFYERTYVKWLADNANQYRTISA